MGRRPHRHAIPPTLVIIKQIDIRDIPLFKAKNDAPVSANGNAPVPREIARQRMEPEPRQIEVRRLRRYVQPRQHARDLLDVFRVDAAPIIVGVEPPQTTMSNPPDHLPAEVWRQLSIVNTTSIYRASVKGQRDRGSWVKRSRVSG